MLNWRKYYKILLPGLIMLLCMRLGAQEENLLRAQQLHQAKRTAEAILAIDSVVRHPQTSGDFIAWTTRAFIYFEVYKRTEKQKLFSPIRDTIIASLRVSQQLKPDSVFQKNNRNLLVNLSAGYFNLAKTLLMDSLNYERSHIAYEKYKEVLTMAEPGTDFKPKDVEYYLAVGSHYSDIFSRDNNNTGAADIAKVALLKILDIQPDHPSALTNMGLMYYNQAVNLSKSLDYGADISQIDFVQDNMVKLAKQAEQFIVQVYNNDNGNKKAVEALYYIYRMLNDISKSDDFKTRCKDLGINLELTTSGK